MRLRKSMLQARRRVYRRQLFTDAEARKDAPEQIVCAELAGDLAETLRSQPQLLGKELELTIALRGVLLRDLEVRACCLQRLQMPLACKEHRLARRLAPPGDAQQFRAQAVEARTCLR